MKITNSQLKRVVIEEMHKILNEKKSAFILGKERKQNDLLSKQGTAHGLWNAGISIKDIQKSLIAVKDKPKGLKYLEILKGADGKGKFDDGDYGPATYKAIVAFQKDYPPGKYGADGLVGGYTAAQLIAQAPTSPFARKADRKGTAIVLGQAAHNFLQSMIGKGQTTGKGKKGIKPSTYSQMAGQGDMPGDSKAAKGGGMQQDLENLIDQVNKGAMDAQKAIIKILDLGEVARSGIGGPGVVPRSYIVRAIAQKNKEGRRDPYAKAVAKAAQELLTKSDKGLGATTDMLSSKVAEITSNLSAGCAGFVGSACKPEQEARFSRVDKKYQAAEKRISKDVDDISLAQGWMFKATENQLKTYIITGVKPSEQRMTNVVDARTGKAQAGGQRRANLGKAMVYYRKLWLDRRYGWKDETNPRNREALADAQFLYKELEKDTNTYEDEVIKRLEKYVNTSSAMLEPGASKEEKAAAWKTDQKIVRLYFMYDVVAGDDTDGPGGTDRSGDYGDTPDLLDSLLKQKDDFNNQIQLLRTVVAKRGVSSKYMKFSKVFTPGASRRAKAKK